MGSSTRIVIFVITNALVFKFTEGQRDFYSWLESINNIDSENVADPSSCRWEDPPEDGYSFSQCSVGVCKGVQGSYRRNGIVRVTQCRKHFTLTGGSDRDLCDNGKWSSEGHKCLPCGRSQRTLDSTAALTLSSTGDFPWQAALYTQIDSQGQWELICGGTLISPKLVIAAAHCLSLSGTDLQADTVRVGFGKLNNLYSQEASSTLSSVSEISRFANYDGLYTPYDQDVVLVVLAKSVALSSMVMPVCLDWKDALPAPKNRDIAYLPKWEVTQTASAPSSLPYWTSLQYIDFATCSLAAGKGEVLTKDKFCAAQSKDVDKDDGEGGLTILREGVHYLYGIVNTEIFGEEKNLRVFTSFQNRTYRDWVQQNVRRVHSQQEVSGCQTNTDCPREMVCGDEGGCTDPCLDSCSKDCSCEVENHIPKCSCAESSAITSDPKISSAMTSDPKISSAMTSNPKISSAMTNNPTPEVSNTQMMEASTPNYEQAPGEVCRQEGSNLYTCQRKSECQKKWGTTSLDAERAKQPCNSENEDHDEDPLVCCVWLKGQPDDDENVKMCRWFAQSVYSPVRRDNGTFVLEDTCAIYKESLNIGNWSDLQKRELPHMALIADENYQRWCIGVLISDMYILSSAFCLHRNEPMTKARLGVYDPFTTDLATATDYDVEEVIFHPQYDRDNPGVYNNIALVKLNTSVQFNPFVRPICLHNRHVFPETPVMLVGRLDGVAQKQNTTVISKLECEKFVEGDTLFDRGVADDAMVCVKSPGSFEFSGGMPLQVKLNEPYCMYGLVGISSYLKKVENGKFDVPLFMRVSHYIPWIENILWPKQGYLNIPSTYPR